MCVYQLPTNLVANTHGDPQENHHGVLDVFGSREGSRSNRPAVFVGWFLLFAWGRLLGQIMRGLCCGWWGSHLSQPNVVPFRILGLDVLSNSGNQTMNSWLPCCFDVRLFSCCIQCSLLFLVSPVVNRTPNYSHAACCTHALTISILQIEGFRNQEWIVLEDHPVKYDFLSL